MRDAGDSLLTDFWYLALPGRALSPGRMAAKQLLGEPVLIARAPRQKEKQFEPAPLGWRMKRHRLPPENLARKLLGANVTSENPLRAHAALARLSETSRRGGRANGPRRRNLLSLGGGALRGASRSL